MKVQIFNAPQLHEIKVNISHLFHIENLSVWKKLAKSISDKFTNIFIFGVGGSSLAGQVLSKFASVKSPRVRFIDVIDEEVMYSIEKFPIEEAYFVFITKSGETIETTLQANYCLKLLQNAGRSFKENCLVLTMKDTLLWNFAIKNNIPIIEHPDISGRFSCFTAVAIFPALLAGVDVDSYIDGGREQSAKPFQATFANAMLKKDIHVIMPYIQKLSIFTEWYSQLAAESLSKNGKGYCVLRAQGTKDQHNQLQMFLDGKDNKTYTFIGVNQHNTGLVESIISSTHSSSTSFSCVMQAGMHGVAQELINQGKSIRIIEFDGSITTKELGKLFAIYMQEVLHQAFTLNVEPCTQPAVSSAKKLMCEFLNNE